MPRRLSIALLALALLACRHPAPAPSRDAGVVDSGPVAGAPAVDAGAAPHHIFAAGGHAISVATSGTLTVASTGALGPYLNLTGSLTGNLNLDFGPGPGWWLVSTEDTSFSLGGHTLAFQSGGSTVSSIVAGQLYSVATFGANTISVSQGVSASVTVSAGTGISVSGGPSYTVTLSTPVTVPNGGTGDNSIVTHAVVLGEGASALSSTGPNSATGIPLVSQGTGSDPLFGTAAVSGGGTGSTTLTAHAVLVGEGTSAIGAVGPGAAGIPLVGVASADPAFGTAVVAGGGTGVTTLTAGGLVQANGTSAFSTIGPGVLGSVPFSTGSVFTTVVSTNFLPTTAFAARASATATTTVTNINSKSITVPNGIKITILIWFDFGPNTDCTSCADDMTYGDGINSSSLFTVSATTTIPPNLGAGTAATGRSAVPFIDQTTSSGSAITVHALAQVPGSVAVSNPVGATILLVETN